MATNLAVKPQWSQPPYQIPVDTSQPCEEFQYAVKVVCGAYEAPPASQLILAPGRYFTAINIHNPSTCKTVTFRWKLAIAKGINSPPRGEISTFATFSLRPDEAIEIDTAEILSAKFLMALPRFNFVKGFVVIESQCELDVVAVYTASSLGTAPSAGAVAFHTERVPYRRIAACRENVAKDISTGVADWTLISAPVGITFPRLANVLEPGDVSGWNAAAAIKWISVRANFANPKIPTIAGEYIYQTCFSLCSGFENPDLTVNVMADPQAEVWLNDQFLGVTAGSPNSWSSSTAIPVNPGYFKPGLNCLSCVV